MSMEPASEDVVKTCGIIFRALSQQMWRMASPDEQRRMVYSFGFMIEQAPQIMREGGSDYIIPLTIQILAKTVPDLCRRAATTLRDREIANASAEESRLASEVGETVVNIVEWAIVASKNINVTLV